MAKKRNPRRPREEAEIILKQFVHVDCSGRRPVAEPGLLLLAFALLLCLVSCTATGPTAAESSPVIAEERAREVAVIAATQMGIDVEAYTIDAQQSDGGWLFSFQERGAERRGWPAHFSIRVRGEDNVEVFRGR